MDIASVVGLVLAFGLILGSILMAPGAKLSAFVDVPSGMVVIGGAIAATMISFPLKNFLAVFKVSIKCILNKQEDLPALIETIVGLAETARRDGLLALESKVADLENPFVISGIQMAVDGTRPEVIEDIMRTEMDAVSSRHGYGKAVFDQLGRYAPAFGMIGTLIGLVIMLGAMGENPDGIGAGMAVALITTLYGAIVSNAIFLPFAEKLGFINKTELLAMEIVVRGIMAIQSGENPRVIEQKLNTFLPASQRLGAQEAA